MKVCDLNDVGRMQKMDGTQGSASHGPMRSCETSQRLLWGDTPARSLTRQGWDRGARDLVGHHWLMALTHKVWKLAVGLDPN